MRKNLLNVIHAAVLFSIVLALPLMQSCSKCSTDHDGKDESVFNRITEEQFARHTATDEYEQSGHSKAINLNPVLGMQIRAKAGAFETTPDIRVTEIEDEGLVDRIEQTIRKVYGQDHELLFAYDIDAGLDFDDMIPGVYIVDLDLKELEIPENLWPYIRAYRTDGSSRTQSLNIHVDEDGILRYEARQNSVIAICLTVGWYAWKFVPIAVWVADKFNLVALVTGAIMAPWTYRAGIVERARTWWEAFGWPKNWWKRKDWITLYVNDPSGHFYVHFRYSHTEEYAKAEEMVDKMGEYAKLSDKMKIKAKSIFEKDYKNNADYRAQNDWKARKFSPKNKLFRNVRTKRLEKLTIDSLYYDLMRNDSEIQEIQNAIPQSVRDIIEGMRLAERFCQDKEGLGLKRLPYEVNVYIADKMYTGAVSDAISDITPIFGETNGGVLFVNANNMYEISGDTYVYNSNMKDKLSVTLAHELAHLYEYTYINWLKVKQMRDNRFIECIGSVSEYWFTAWLKKNGYIDYDPMDKAHEKMYADRELREVLAWPLVNKAGSWPNDVASINDPDTRGGYMLGDLFDCLCEATGQRPSFDHVMNNYALKKTLAQDFMDIFGIKTEAEFYKIYEAFCRKFIFGIVESQQNCAPYARLRPYFIINWKHNINHCVYHIDNITNPEKPEPFAIKSFEMFSKGDLTDDSKASQAKKLYYTVFALPSDNVKPNEVFFSFLDGSLQKKGSHPIDGLQFTKDPYCFTPKGDNFRKAYAAVMLRPDIRTAKVKDNYYIDVVALYQPYIDPTVEGVLKDGTGLLVHTRDVPCYDLKIHGYITGMQIGVRNNKTHQTSTLNVPLNLCGEKVKIPFEKIGVTNKNDIDLTIQTRWYYKHKDGKKYYSPASNKVNYKRQSKEKVELKEEKLATEPAEEMILNSDFRVTAGPFAGVMDSYHVYDMNEVKGHISISKSHISISIPAQELKTKSGERLGTIKVPAISVTGSYDETENISGTIVYRGLTFSPSELKVMQYWESGSSYGRQTTFEPNTVIMSYNPREKTIDFTALCTRSVEGYGETMDKGINGQTVRDNPPRTGYSGVIE